MQSDRQTAVEYCSAVKAFKAALNHRSCFGTYISTSEVQWLSWHPIVCDV